MQYNYHSNGQLETIQKDNTTIASYTYNARNEVIKLIQATTTTHKTYDDMGRVLTQQSIKDGNVIFDATYTYDANDNIIQEVIDGKSNTYTYNAYDELEESNKYIDGKLVTTRYTHDVFGNQITSSSSDGKKTYKYNDKNQVESIDTDLGIIKFSYDVNGNVSKKVNEDGRVDVYTYDTFNQLVKLEQGQYVYDYSYDAEQERIKQIRTDIKDYHYDVWYQYTQAFDVVGDEEIKDTFDNLREQAKKKQSNGNVCNSVLSDKYDVTYYQEPETNEYLLDRNADYTEVLANNDSINIYGDSLLQTNNEDVVTGWNDSVVAKVSNDKVNKISYNDYGYTKDIASGHGYNAEMMDHTGLIYLRARYYDPSVARFIQIDTHYDGEKESVVSQNRYAYTMNNPYKYVDKDGKRSLKPIFSGAAISALSYLTMSDKEFKKFLKKVPFHEKLKYINNRVRYQLQVRQNQNAVVDTGNNSTSNKGGGSNSKKTKPKKEKVIKCPEKSESDVSLLDILLNCIDWIGALKDTIVAFESNIKFNGADIIMKHIKSGDLNIGGIKVTVSGVREKVKTITNLATGPKTKVSTVLKKNMKTHISAAYTGFGLFTALVSLASSVAEGVFDLMLGLITKIRLIAIPLGNILYSIIRTVSSSILKTILMPFFGPFAWLITLIIDVGIDIIDWFVDLEREVTNFVSWMLQQSWTTVTNFVYAIKKII